MENEVLEFAELHRLKPLLVQEYERHLTNPQYDNRYDLNDLICDLRRWEYEFLDAHEVNVSFDYSGYDGISWDGTITLEVSYLKSLETLQGELAEREQKQLKPQDSKRLEELKELERLKAKYE